jgi:6-pyruvoyltetrahydropterin/6-carboxytetrahydropterin synthase
MVQSKPEVRPAAYEITREIGIDAGHRVTLHGSKCRNLHGHRYTVQATCRGTLRVGGHQDGMVLDFGFLKEEMMREIDAPCDHGLILWVEDPLAKLWVPSREDLSGLHADGYLSLPGLPSGRISDWPGKLYLLPYTPTAENLAQHWFTRLAPRVRERSDDAANLVRVRVYETPNCWADYPR